MRRRLLLCAGLAVLFAAGVVPPPALAGWAKVDPPVPGARLSAEFDGDKALWVVQTLPEGATLWRSSSIGLAWDAIPLPGPDSPYLAGSFAFAAHDRAAWVWPSGDVPCVLGVPGGKRRGRISWVTGGQANMWLPSWVHYDDEYRGWDVGPAVEETVFVDTVHGWATVWGWWINSPPFDSQYTFVSMLFRTEDGGRVWQRADEDHAGWVQRRLWEQPDGSVATPALGGLRRYAPDGSLLSTNSAPPGAPQDVMFVDDLHGWSVGWSSRIDRTNDGGQAWGRLTSGLSEDTVLRSVFFVDESEGWVAGDGGTLLHTTDAGDTWDAVPLGTSETLDDLFFSDQGHGWVSGTTALYRFTQDVAARTARGPAAAAAVRRATLRR